MWQDLTIQRVEAYLALTDAQKRLAFLQGNVLGGLPDEILNNPERVNIVLDFYYYTLQFGINAPSQLTSCRSSFPS